MNPSVGDGPTFSTAQLYTTTTPDNVLNHSIRHNPDLGGQQRLGGLRNQLRSNPLYSGPHTRGINTEDFCPFFFCLYCPDR